jgi:hypothetical protein
MKYGEVEPGSWRHAARNCIARVIREHGNAIPTEALRAKLSEAYPFGMRKYTPYKVWLDEIKRATGRARPPGVPVDNRTGNLF